MSNSSVPSPKSGREYYLGGREHARIKHYFLSQYLEILAFKTLQVQRLGSPVFAYIDGFTGPWGAKDETFKDTSFGAALSVLERVKSRLPQSDIRCVFCESRRGAFKDLQTFVKGHAHHVKTKCVPGKFEEHISEIVQFVGQTGFLFAFIDPKGWKVDTAAITPLLEKRWSEVLFTFMAEFAGRFPDYEKVRQSYAALLSNVDWRSQFDSLPAELSNEEKVLWLFRNVLKEKWRFSHVLELPIQKPARDRVFYKLVYGTRSPYGVLAFREAQAKAEREGIAVAIESEKRAQNSLFSPDEQAEHIAASIGVSSRMNIEKLVAQIKDRLRGGDVREFLALAADVLEIVPARERDVKRVLQEMSKKGEVRPANPAGGHRLDRKTMVSIIKS